MQAARKQASNDGLEHKDVIKKRTRQAKDLMEKRIREYSGKERTHDRVSKCSDTKQKKAAQAGLQYLVKCKVYFLHLQGRKKF